MISNFKIDQTATFAGIAYLSSEPKMRFGVTEQETTKDGLPKWEIQVVAGFKDQFGRVKNEVLKIGVAAPKNPGDGLLPYTPMQLIDFEVGVMEKTKRHPNTGEEKLVGVQVWYRAGGLRPITATSKAA